MRVDLAIRIPENHRLSVHAMTALMNMNNRCMYNIDGNMFIVCDDDTFSSLESDVYKIIGVAYDGHIYNDASPSSNRENIILEPIDLWDEYTEYVELSV